MSITCVHCGKPPPPHQNYCDWDCVVASAEACGGRKITPNGLPIRCVTADGTMLECAGGDHPTYLFPVVVDVVNLDGDIGSDTETHALICGRTHSRRRTSSRTSARGTSAGACMGTPIG